jgi:16S rRNA processing protein RimM
VGGGDQRDQKLVPLGFISGIHGIKGWVKIHSFTSPRAAILGYQPWLLGENHKSVSIEEGKQQGKTIVASLPGVEDRERARELVGMDIAIVRDQLPETDGESYYWTDLVGLAVETRDGVELGHVMRMMETGAHDVMVVKGDRERLIPFVPGRFVINVNLEAGKLVVDWEPDFLE